MAAAAGGPKVELTPSQSWDILKTLEILDHPAHMQDKLIYTPISIKLDKSSGFWRGWNETYNSWTGGDQTPNIEALPPLIEKVHECITKNESIFNDQTARSKYTEQIPKAVTGLESLKKSQYSDQSKKQALIDRAVESLKAAKAALEKKRDEWLSTQVKGYKARSEEESQQKEKDLRIARLEAEKKELESQLAAKEVLGAANFEGISKEKLCETIRLLVTYLEKKA